MTRRPVAALVAFSLLLACPGMEAWAVVGRMRPAPRPSRLVSGTALKLPDASVRTLPLLPPAFAGAPEAAAVPAPAPAPLAARDQAARLVPAERAGQPPPHAAVYDGAAAAARGAGLPVLPASFAPAASARLAPAGAGVAGVAGMAMGLPRGSGVVSPSSPAWRGLLRSLRPLTHEPVRRYHALGAGLFIGAAGIAVLLSPVLAPYATWVFIGGMAAIAWGARYSRSHFKMSKELFGALAFGAVASAVAVLALAPAVPWYAAPLAFAAITSYLTELEAGKLKGPFDFPAYSRMQSRAAAGGMRLDEDDKDILDDLSSSGRRRDAAYAALKADPARARRLRPALAPLLLYPDVPALDIPKLLEAYEAMGGSAAIADLESLKDTDMAYAPSRPVLARMREALAPALRTAELADLARSDRLDPRFQEALDAADAFLARPPLSLVDRVAHETVAGLAAELRAALAATPKDDAAAALAASRLKAQLEGQAGGSALRSLPADASVLWRAPARAVRRLMRLPEVRVLPWTVPILGAAAWAASSSFLVGVAIAGLAMLGGIAVLMLMIDGKLPRGSTRARNATAVVIAAGVLAFSVVQASVLSAPPAMVAGLIVVVTLAAIGGLSIAARMVAPGDRLLPAFASARLRGASAALREKDKDLIEGLHGEWPERSRTYSALQGSPETARRLRAPLESLLIDPSLPAADRPELHRVVEAMGDRRALNALKAASGVDADVLARLEKRVAAMEKLDELTDLARGADEGSAEARSELDFLLEAARARLALPAEGLVARRTNEEVGRLAAELEAARASGDASAAALAATRLKALLEGAASGQGLASSLVRVPLLALERAFWDLHGRLADALVRAGAERWFRDAHHTKPAVRLAVTGSLSTVAKLVLWALLISFSIVVVDGMVPWDAMKLGTTTAILALAAGALSVVPRLLYHGARAALFAPYPQDSLDRDRARAAAALRRRLGPAGERDLRRAIGDSLHEVRRFTLSQQSARNPLGSPRVPPRLPDPFLALASEDQALRHASWAVAGERLAKEVPAPDLVALMGPDIRSEAELDVLPRLGEPGFLRLLHAARHGIPLVYGLHGQNLTLDALPALRDSVRRHAATDAQLADAEALFRERGDEKGLEAVAFRRRMRGLQDALDRAQGPSDAEEAALLARADALLSDRGASLPDRARREAVAREAASLRAAAASGEASSRALAAERLRALIEGAAQGQGLASSALRRRVARVWEFAGGWRTPATVAAYAALAFAASLLPEGVAKDVLSVGGLLALLSTFATQSPHRRWFWIAGTAMLAAAASVGGGPWVLVGLSMGFMVALAAWVKTPRLVRSTLVVRFAREAARSLALSAEDRELLEDLLGPSLPRRAAAYAELTSSPARARGFRRVMKAMLKSRDLDASEEEDVIRVFEAMRDDEAVSDLRSVINSEAAVRAAGRMEKDLKAARELAELATAEAAMLTEEEPADDGVLAEAQAYLSRPSDGGLIASLARAEVERLAGELRAARAAGDGSAAALAESRLRARLEGRAEGESLAASRGTGSVAAWQLLARAAALFALAAPTIAAATVAPWLALVLGLATLIYAVPVALMRRPDGAPPVALSDALPVPAIRAAAARAMSAAGVPLALMPLVGVYADASIPAEQRAERETWGGWSTGSVGSADAAIGAGLGYADEAGPALDGVVAHELSHVVHKDADRTWSWRAWNAAASRVTAAGAPAALVALFLFKGALAVVGALPLAGAPAALASLFLLQGLAAVLAAWPLLLAGAAALAVSYLSGRAMSRAMETRADRDAAAWAGPAAVAAYLARLASFPGEDGALSLIDDHPALATRLRRWAPGTVAARGASAGIAGGGARGMGLSSGSRAGAWARRLRRARGPLALAGLAAFGAAAAAGGPAVTAALAAGLILVGIGEVMRIWRKNSVSQGAIDRYGRFGLVVVAGIFLPIVLGAATWAATVAVAMTAVLALWAEWRAQAAWARDELVVSPARMSLLRARLREAGLTPGQQDLYEGLFGPWEQRLEAYLALKKDRAAAVAGRKILVEALKAEGIDNLDVIQIVEVFEVIGDERAAQELEDAPLPIGIRLTTIPLIQDLRLKAARAAEAGAAVKEVAALETSAPGEADARRDALLADADAAAAGAAADLVSQRRRDGLARLAGELRRARAADDASGAALAEARLRAMLAGEDDGSGMGLAFSSGAAARLDALSVVWRFPARLVRRLTRETALVAVPPVLILVPLVAGWAAASFTVGWAVIGGNALALVLSVALMTRNPSGTASAPRLIVVLFPLALACAATSLAVIFSGGLTSVGIFLGLAVGLGLAFKMGAGSVGRWTPLQRRSVRAAMRGVSQRDLSLLEGLFGGERERFATYDALKADPERARRLLGPIEAAAVSPHAVFEDSRKLAEVLAAAGDEKALDILRRMNHGHPDLIEETARRLAGKSMRDLAEAEREVAESGAAADGPRRTLDRARARLLGAEPAGLVARRQRAQMETLVAELEAALKAEDAAAATLAEARLRALLDGGSEGAGLASAGAAAAFGSFALPPAPHGWGALRRAARFVWIQPALSLAAASLVLVPLLAVLGVAAGGATSWVMGVYVFGATGSILATLSGIIPAAWRYRGWTLGLVGMMAALTLGTPMSLVLAVSASGAAAFAIGCMVVWRGAGAGYSPMTILAAERALRGRVLEAGDRDALLGLWGRLEHRQDALTAIASSPARARRLRPALEAVMRQGEYADQDAPYLAAAFESMSDREAAEFLESLPAGHMAADAARAAATRLRRRIEGAVGLEDALRAESAGSDARAELKARARRHADALGADLVSSSARGRVETLLAELDAAEMGGDAAATALAEARLRALFDGSAEGQGLAGAGAAAAFGSFSLPPAPRGLDALWRVPARVIKRVLINPALSAFLGAAAAFPAAAAARLALGNDLVFILGSMALLGPAINAAHPTTRWALQSAMGAIIAAGMGQSTVLGLLLVGYVFLMMWLLDSFGRSPFLLAKVERAARGASAEDKDALVELWGSAERRAAVIERLRSEPERARRLGPALEVLIRARPDDELIELFEAMNVAAAAEVLESFPAGHSLAGPARAAAARLRARLEGAKGLDAALRAESSGTDARTVLRERANAFSAALGAGLVATRERARVETLLAELAAAETAGDAPAAALAEVRLRALLDGENAPYRV